MQRKTKQQELILGVLAKTKEHPSATAVYESVKKQDPKVGRATVFRVLGRLADEGKIKRLGFPESEDRFDFRTDEHCHARCRVCGRVVDVELSKQISPMKSVTACCGYELTNCEIEFFGICPECRDKN